MTILTVTDVVEHVFCPKFTYYSSVLGLKQYEEKRGTVKAGRQLHQKHEKTNKDYTPQPFLGKKLTGRKYYSQKLNLSGKIDEAVETQDEIILIERKYTDYTELQDTLKVQLGLLSILIEENTGKPVKKAQVIFSKQNRIVKNYQIDESIKRYALKMLNETKKVISNSIIPFSEFDNRCLNCCFRKICPTGSLNIDE
jgi:CRISPR-associated exonuclease Cas4